MSESFNCDYTIDDDDILTIKVDLKRRPKRSGTDKNATIASTGGNKHLWKDNKERREIIGFTIFVKDLTDQEKLIKMIEIAQTKKLNKDVAKQLEAVRVALAYGHHYQFRALNDITEEVE